MYTVGKELHYESITEAKLALLVQLTNSDDVESNGTIIELLKVSIEQHQSKDELLESLQAHHRVLGQSPFVETLDAIKRSNFKLLPTEAMNCHPTLGAVETFLPALLFKEPTPAMNDVMQKISQSIRSTLDFYKENDFTKEGRNFYQQFNYFAFGMIFEASNEYLGAFSLNDINLQIGPDHQIDLSANSLTDFQIKFILGKTIETLDNPKSSLDKVMQIHAMFGFKLQKIVPMIASSSSPPSYEDAIDIKENTFLEDIVNKFNKYHNVSDTDIYGVEAFVQMLRNEDPIYDPVRAFVSDNLMYSSVLYQVESHRGRGNPPGDLTSHLGVMRGSSPDLLTGMPVDESKLQRLDWSKCEFYPNSLLVQSMVQHEVPFIASYSGTISLLMSLIVSSGAIQSKKEQQIYITACMAYIVSIGHHSIHEVLGPISQCLGLISNEDYPISVPTADNLGSPPQYNNFYKIAAQNDNDFADRRTRSWEQLTDWYQNTYVKHNQPDVQKLLLYAIQANDMSLAKKLVDNGANINAPGVAQQTCLHDAVDANRIDLFTREMNLGADPNKVDVNEWSPLHLAVRKGLNDIVKELAQDNQVNHKLKDNQGNTALMIAIYAKSKENTDILLNAVNRPEELEELVNTPNMQEKTPLHLAVESQNVELVKILIKAGAELEAVDYYGNTPLMLIVQNKDQELFKIFMNADAKVDYVEGDGVTLLHHAAKNGASTIVNALLKKGLNPLQQDTDGNTPLLLAIKNGRMKSFGHIFDKVAGAKKDDLIKVVNLPNNQGMTPLHFAVKNNNVDLVKKLIEAGAKIQVPNNKGELPMLLALQGGGGSDLIDALTKKTQETVVDFMAEFRRITSEGKPKDAPDEDEQQAKTAPRS